jgi:hypothetical protein
MVQLLGNRDLIATIFGELIDEGPNHKQRFHNWQLLAEIPRLVRDCFQAC